MSFKASTLIDATQAFGFLTILALSCIGSCTWYGGIVADLAWTTLRDILHILH